MQQFCFYLASVAVKELSSHLFLTLVSDIFSLTLCVFPFSFASEYLLNKPAAFQWRAPTVIKQICFSISKFSIFRSRTYPFCLQSRLDFFHCPSSSLASTQIMNISINQLFYFDLPTKRVLRKVLTLGNVAQRPINKSLCIICDLRCIIWIRCVSFSFYFI